MFLRAPNWTHAKFSEDISDGVATVSGSALRNSQYSSASEFCSDVNARLMTGEFEMVELD
jgi:hypothetical protein